jgi:hypothetical protein
MTQAPGWQPDEGIKGPRASAAQIKRPGRNSARLSAVDTLLVEARGQEMAAPSVDLRWRLSPQPPAKDRTMERTKTVDQRVDWLGGQVSALMACLHAVICQHPNRQAVAEQMSESIERLLTASLRSPIPDEYQRGIELVRDQLLRRPADPGQPERR